MTIVIPNGRSREGMRRTVLMLTRTRGGLSTFECERDPKLAEMVTHLLGTGEVVRGPDYQYPWVSLQIPGAKR